MASEGPTEQPIRLDETGDAMLRTHLANERTYLAWWRSGLTSLAVSAGVGRVLPTVAEQTRWPYAILGSGFALLGIAFLLYGLHRQRQVNAALARGQYVVPHGGTLMVLTIFGVVLSVVLLVLVAVKL